MTTITIQLDQSGESQTFEASRDVRNSDHDLGTIEAGTQVFFREWNDRSLTLCHQVTGEPTNGNQYAEFATVAEAEEFARRSGLVPVEEAMLECAYCGHEAPEAPVPATSDDEAWAAIARQHAEDCEWVATRAHRA